MASSEYNPFGSANGAILTRRAWSDVLHMQVQDKLFFTKRGFIGADKGGEDGLEDTVSWYPVVEKTEIGKNQGDSVRVGLLRQLSGDGVTGNNALETNEEGMDFDGFLVWLELQRHATGWQSKMSQQRNRFHTKANASRLLTTWLAQKMDDSVFNSFYNGASAHVITEISGVSSVVHPNQYYAGQATSDDDLQVGDVFNTETLERMSVWAEENNINPCIMPNGETGYSVIIHPRQLRTLRADDWWRRSNAEALPRSYDNPIFSRAEGIYSGIAIHCSNKIASPATGANADDIKRAIFMGAHSVARAIGQHPEMIADDSTDYHREHHWAIDCIYGDRRADYERDDAGGNPNFNQSSSVWNTWAEDPVS